MYITPMNNFPQQSFTSRIVVPTNGVLRCLSGDVPLSKSDADLKNAKDIWLTVKRTFNYKDKDLLDMQKKKDPIGPFLLTISAGRYLELKNPGLGKIKSTLTNAKKEGMLNETISKIVEDLGERLGLDI